MSWLGKFHALVFKSCWISSRQYSLMEKDLVVWLLFGTRKALYLHIHIEYEGTVLELQLPVKSAAENITISEMADLLLAINCIYRINTSLFDSLMSSLLNRIKYTPSACLLRLTWSLA